MTITQKRVAEIVQKHVAQKESGPFEVKLDEFVEVEPVLPGCTCHPHKLSFKPGANNAKLSFWVVPHVLGPVKGALVAIRQDGNSLAEVPLDIRVRKRTAAVVAGVFGLVFPFASAVLKKFGVDFQSGGDFNVYLSVLDAVFTKVPPTALFAVGAGLALAFWWWSRPRRATSSGT